MKSKAGFFKACIMVLALLVVCGAAVSAEAASGPDGKPRYVLGVVLIDMTNQFFVDMIEGGNRAAEDYGVQVIWKSADNSQENQISLTENFIEQGVDCILVNPIDNDAMKPTIEKAAAAGIPTVTMAGQVDVDTNYATVYNDLDNTRQIAEIIGNKIGGAGKVALLYGNKGNLVSDLRQEGFHRGIAKFPGITVVEQPMNWDPAEGMKAAQDIIAANPDLKALHCVSDAVTIAAYQAIVVAGKQDQILVTSYDGNPDSCAMVEAGSFYCTLLTGAKKTGYWNVQMGVALAAGARPEEHILNLDTHLVINEKNIPEFEKMGIEPKRSVITPQEALGRVEKYRDDIYDPDIMAVIERS
ncbi:MAG: sugar ABC transporter substrate-binding protein [Synergistaceae bacterium]|nr:sugar ABC transporter substrate-binding protein [Synergistaceae bacterium]